MAKDARAPKDIHQIRLEKVKGNLARTKLTLAEIKEHSSSTMHSKLAKTLASKENIGPCISTSEGWVIVPSSFEEADNYIGWTINGLAQLLGLEVYTIEYTGPKNEAMLDISEKISMGMFIALSDFDKKIRIKKGKTDPVELGRTIFRAQQTLRLYTSPNLGMDALRRDHFFFGNNPTEKEEIEKEVVKVKYSAKTLDHLFEEKDWAEELRKLLLTLIRESARLLSDEAATHSIVTTLLTKEETIHTYCSTTSTVTTGKGRKKKEEKVREVPKRPLPSTLLTQGENQFIDSISKNIFKDPFPDDVAWADLISKSGYTTIRGLLRRSYAERRLFRQAYARITTSRLKDFRKLKPDLRYKKKKDVTGVDLDMLITSRNTKEATFASEVSYLDPTFSTALAYYRTEVTKGTRTIVDTMASKMKIAEDLERLGTYSDVKHIKPEDPEWVQVGTMKIPELALPKVQKGNKFDANLPGKPDEDAYSEDLGYNYTHYYDHEGNVWNSNWDRLLSTEEAKLIDPEDIKPYVSQAKNKQPERPETPAPSSSSKLTGAMGTKAISNQIEYDLLRSEKLNLLDTESIQRAARIWITLPEITSSDKNSLATETNYKLITKFLQQKAPCIYKLLKPASTKWYVDRDFKLFIETDFDPSLRKMNKDNYDSLLKQTALIFKKLATCDEVTAATNSLMG
jgi:hypothetical protein